MVLGLVTQTLSARPPVGCPQTSLNGFDRKNHNGLPVRRSWRGRTTPLRRLPQRSLVAFIRWHLRGGRGFYKQGHECLEMCFVDSPIEQHGDGFS
jgi:hypothetical protein